MNRLRTQASHNIWVENVGRNREVVKSSSWISFNLCDDFWVYFLASYIWPANSVGSMSDKMLLKCRTNPIVLLTIYKCFQYNNSWMEETSTIYHRPTHYRIHIAISLLTTCYLELRHIPFDRPFVKFGFLPIKKLTFSGMHSFYQAFAVFFSFFAFTSTISRSRLFPLDNIGD